MVRKATVGAVALAVLVMVAAAIGALIVKDWLHDTDVLMFGGGPASAKLIDERVGKVDPGSLGLSGDVLLRSKGDGGLYVQDLDAADRPAVKLFDALVVRGVSPDTGLSPDLRVAEKSSRSAGCHCQGYSFVYAAK